MTSSTSHWRGPKHDGNYPHETSWQATWPAAGPKQLWRVEVGIGYSDLAISDGRAYTVGNIDKQDIIYCLDAASGEKLWVKQYAQDLMTKYNAGGPNAAPVIDGPWLYIFSKQGLVSCFDKSSGALRWRTDIAQVAGAKVPVWGFSSAPLIVGNQLFLNANESGLALDKNSGALLWNSPVAECGYAAVVEYKFLQEPAIAIFGARELFVVRQRDGQILWRVDWPTKMGENSADPLVLEGRLYVSSWWGMGAALFNPTDMNRDRQEPLWRNKAFQNHISGAVPFQGYLYGSHGPVHRRTSEASICCLDIDTGETKWSEPNLKGSLIIANKTLLILTHDGRLVTAKATPKGFEKIASHEGLGARTWAPPVLHDGRLYIRDADGWASCLDLR